MDFVWDGAKRHPVNADTLRASKEEGGLSLFCAKERNDAQYLTWLGLYLLPAPTRPTWAYIADQLLQAAATGESKKKVPEEQRRDPFTQSWKANPRKLPFILQQMVRVARKYHLAFDAPDIPQRIREQMNVWAHPASLGERRRPLKPWTIRCLKLYHAVDTVEDLEEIAELDADGHEEASDCDCNNCVDDRAEGCRHPYRCQGMASELIGNIAERWNPSYPSPEYRTDLQDLFADTHDDWREDRETYIPFVKCAEAPARIEDMARICVHAIGMNQAPATETMRREAGYVRDEGPNESPVHVIVCAGMTNDGTDEARGGFAVHFPNGEYSEIDQPCAGEGHSYIRALALGVIKALQSIPSNQDVYMVLTSRTMIQYLTKNLAEHERRGWMGVRESAELRATAAAIRSRSGEVVFYHVGKKRREKWPDVKETQVRATAIAMLDEGRVVTTQEYSAFDRPGMSLIGLRQREAAWAVREASKVSASPRKTTEKNISTIKADISSYCGYTPTTEQIWRGIRGNDMSRQARNFLWKAVHGAHKIGSYFHKMPSPWKEMAQCPTCGIEESMEHILLDCPDSKQAVIWEQVGKFFEMRRIDAGVSLGTILGCANVRLEGFGSNRDPPKERAYRIVVAESAFLAWKLRCEKRIEHADDPEWTISDKEAKTRWQHMIRARRWQDRFLAKSRRRYPVGSNQRYITWATWRDMSIPECTSVFQITKELDGYRHLGVFVGSDEERAVGIG
ncbi:hypothetical protein AURDEDRAFT_67864 [Auricularia subglabra TFB-10046 SS5]|nr:hypothetical protein AURDEDRAFT_67864 [Auricularia subglabra TFB-10046 SS5]